MATFTGTSLGDTLTGGAENDIINGLGGNDYLRGGAGDDALNGGEQRFLAWKSGQTFATTDTDRADYTTVTTGGIRLDLSTMKVTGGTQVGTDTLRGIEEVRGTNQSDTVVGSFAAISGNNEAAGHQHSLDLTLYGGSDTVTLSKVQSMPWVDAAYMAYWWSKTGVNAVFTGSVGTIRYTASGTQAAGTDTTDGVSSFGDSPFDDRFDFSGMTSNWSVGGKFNYVNLNEGGNDTVVGNGDTTINFSNNTLTSTTGLGVNVRLAAPGTSFTVDMTHLKRVGASWSFGTVTLSNIDTVRGTLLNDTLVGGAYDDLETFRGKAGNDSIDGGSGYDRADYLGSTGGVSVNLAAGTATGDASIGSDTLRSIEMIRGTVFDDVYDARGFSGTSVNAGSEAEYNAFEGRGGNDTIYGNGQTRISYGASGVAVEVNLASGKAWALNSADRTGELNQYVGTDTFTGVYRVSGSALGDLLLGGGAGWAFGDSTSEQFDPDAGNDTVNGFGGQDWVRYGSSTAAITVDLRLASGQVQDGMGGVDTLIGIEGVTGSEFNDSMVGSDTNNTGFGNQEVFAGGKGNDTLNGGGGYDEVNYNDDPTNGVVVNLATGVAQDGWGGTDTLISIEGVEGSKKDDRITGSSADNDLDGRAGNDTLDGGAGTDTAEYNQASGAVQVNLALGTATGADGNDTLISIENVRGSVHGDLLTGNAGANVLEGLAGNDTLSGGAGSDTARYNFGTVNYTGETSLTGNVTDGWTLSVGTTALLKVKADTTSGEWTVSDLRTTVPTESTAFGIDKLIDMETLGLDIQKGNQLTRAADLLIGGTVAAPTLKLSGAAEITSGTSANNTLTGGTGNDTLSGGAGNDSLSGGAGIDTVVFSGSRSSYNISKSSTGLTVSSTAEGVDTLADVERLKFADASVALDINGTAGQAYRVYQAAFNRTPDNGGLKYWIGLMDGGYTLAGVASGFIASDEFKTLYGSNPTNELFVSKLYDNVLHRTPDTGGYNYWVGLLNTKKIDSISAFINFSESPENQAGVIGVIQNGIDLLN